MEVQAYLFQAISMRCLKESPEKILSDFFNTQKSEN